MSGLNGPHAPALTSVHNPRVKAVVRLREHRGRREAGRFIAEGLREMTRAADAGLRCVEWYVCDTLLPEAQALPLAAALGRAATRVSAGVLEKMAYHRRPEGALGVFESPAPAALPVADASGPMVLVAVGTAKPGNLGAMARTASAAGCAALVAAGTPVDVWNPNAIRASTGAVFSLPIVVCDEAEAQTQLRAAGYRLLVSTPEAAGNVPYTDAAYAGAVAVVVGPEDTGLSDAWLNAADTRVTIPMAPGPVDSLNASVTAGHLLLHAAAQRRGPGAALR